MTEDYAGNKMHPVRIAQAPGPLSILAIAAHPDDIESWCAGTLAQAVERGATVRLLLVTSGESGSSDLSAVAQEVATQREEEARRAAKLLGIAEVLFLRYPDGDVENTHALRSDLVEWIRRWQPAIVFTHDPEHPSPAYLCHRDHRIVGRATLDAIYPLARDHMAFAQQIHAGLSPHKVREAWLFASNNADAYVDITTAFERKLSARLAHTSQTPDAAALATSWRARSAAIGNNAGLDYAEAFTILNID